MNYTFAKYKFVLKVIFFQKQSFQKSEYGLFYQLSNLFLKKFCGNTPTYGKVIKRNEQKIFLFIPFFEIV